MRPDAGVRVPVALVSPAKEAGAPGPTARTGRPAPCPWKGRWGEKPQTHLPSVNTVAEGSTTWQQDRPPPTPQNIPVICHPLLLSDERLPLSREPAPQGPDSGPRSSWAHTHSVARSASPSWAVCPPHLGCWWPCRPLSGRRPGRPQQPARWSWGDGRGAVSGGWPRAPSPPQLGHPHLSWECSFVALELKSSQMG